jgi:hypothetical protein
MVLKLTLSFHQSVQSKGNISHYCGINLGFEVYTERLNLCLILHHYYIAEQQKAIETEMKEKNAKKEKNKMFYVY